MYSEIQSLPIKTKLKTNRRYFFYYVALQLKCLLKKYGHFKAQFLDIFTILYSFTCAYSIGNYIFLQQNV